MPQETVGYVELEWTCVHCGTKNEGTRQTCSGCGAPMSDSQKFDLPGQQKLITDKDVLAKAEAGPDIHCPYCGTRNPAGSTKCSHCGGDLTGAAVRTSGEVLGAFQSAPQPDIKCRYCGTMNPADAKKCKNCGAALVAPAAVAPATKALAGRVSGIGIVPIVVIGLLVVACISFFVLSARTTDAIGTVRSMAWQRSISILEQRPVTHEDWRDKVPAGAKLGTCQQQVRRTQDQPAPNAQEVCGTPYTVNKGNGVGKVVEDCRYNVMDDYCEYTSSEWLRVNAVVAQGADNNPQWPNPNLNAAQRAGNRDESYQVTFSAGDKTYTYTTRDATEFAKFTPGSKWTLKVNALGSVTSVSPAK